MRGRSALSDASPRGQTRIRIAYRRIGMRPGEIASIPSMARSAKPFARGKLTPAASQQRRAYWKTLRSRSPNGDCGLSDTTTIQLSTCSTGRFQNGWPRGKQQEAQSQAQGEQRCRKSETHSRTVVHPGLPSPGRGCGHARRNPLRYCMLGTTPITLHPGKMGCNTFPALAGRRQLGQ